MTRKWVSPSPGVPHLATDILSAEADNRPKHAHRYNVQEQQVIYKSEVERVWKTQYASLSRKDEPVLSETEEDSKPPLQGNKRGRAGEAPGTANTTPFTMPSPAFSRASSIDRETSLGPDGNASKVLRIKRFVRLFPAASIRDSPL